MADGIGNEQELELRTRSGLHQLVGYAELMKASGVSRSTLERAWRGPWDANEPHLPKPGKIGSRSVWTAEDANAWLLARARWQCGMVTEMARVNPNDLDPDQLMDSARELTAQAISKHTGQPVDPDDIDLHATHVLPAEEFVAAEVRMFETFRQRFAHFGFMRAALLAAWLLPDLAPILANAAPEPFDMIFRRPEHVRDLGAACLHEDSWTDAGRNLANLRAAHESGKK